MFINKLNWFSFILLTSLSLLWTEFHFQCQSWASWVGRSWWGELSCADLRFQISVAAACLPCPLSADTRWKVPFTGINNSSELKVMMTQMMIMTKKLEKVWWHLKWSWSPGKALRSSSDRETASLMLHSIVNSTLKSFVKIRYLEHGWRIKCKDKKHKSHRHLEQG